MDDDNQDCNIGDCKLILICNVANVTIELHIAYSTDTEVLKFTRVYNATDQQTLYLALSFHSFYISNRCSLQEHKVLIDNTYYLTVMLENIGQPFWLCVRAGVTLIGNFITNNETNQLYLWSTCSPDKSTFFE
jgi:hypothetical protein